MLVRCLRISALAACVFALCGCREPVPGKSTAPVTKAPPTQTLVLGTIHEPDTLDPVFTEVSGAQEIVRLLFADLTVYDDAWRLQPSLAAALPTVETATSGTHVTWRLRDGAKWSDGAPVSAADLLFGFTIESDPKLSSPAVGFLEQVTDRRRVPGGVRFTWKAPTLDAIAPRVHAVLPAHAYPKPTAQSPFRGMGRSPVSSGPFRLAKWVPGQFLTVERNPHWRGTRPALDTITWRFFASEDAFEAELTTGGIQALGESSGLSLARGTGLAKRLAETHEVHFTSSGVWLHLDARLDHPVTGRLDVRRAINQAIDRVQLAHLVYGDQATPAFGVFPPRHPAHSSAPVTIDLEAARKIIARLPKAQRKLTMNLASGSQASGRAGAYLQHQLQEIGLTVELEALPFRALFARMRAKEQAPLSLYAWRSAPDWSGRSVLATGGTQNFVGLSDPEIDAAYARTSTLDQEAWTRALETVEARYRALLPSIPLVFRHSVSVAPRGLDGWRPTGTTSAVTWNAAEWGWRPVDD